MHQIRVHFDCPFLLPCSFLDPAEAEAEAANREVLLVHGENGMTLVDD